MPKNYRQAVSALVVRPLQVCSPDGCGVIHEILLVHKPRKRDTWQLPQGGIERGETPQQAAARELHEEAGLIVGSPVHISTWSYSYDFPEDFVRRHKPYNAGQVLRFVLFEIPPDTVITVDRNELDNYAWVRPQQLHLYVKRMRYLDTVKKFWAECEQYLREAPKTKFEIRK